MLMKKKKAYAAIKSVMVVENPKVAVNLKYRALDDEGPNPVSATYVGKKLMKPIPRSSLKLIIANR